MRLESSPITQIRHFESSDLEEFRAYIEEVVADGRLSRQKLEAINAHVSPGEAIAPKKLSFVREFMRERMLQGQLEFSQE